MNQVKKFARQNAELASKHALLRDLVSNLLKGDSISLLTNQNVWKDTLRNMRDIVDSVESNYGNTKAWKLHWDRQLLNALWIAYRYICCIIVILNVELDYSIMQIGLLLKKKNREFRKNSIRTASIDLVLL